MNTPDTPPEVIAMAKRLFHAQNPNGRPWDHQSYKLHDKYVRLICACGAADLLQSLKSTPQGAAAVRNLIPIT